MRSSRLSFRTGVLIRILLILATGMAAILIASKSTFWLISAWLVVLVIGLIIELLRYHERSHKAFREFLHYINQGDFISISTTDENNSEFQDAYKMLFEKFRNLRIEKEANYHYLKRIIEHVDTALICLQDDREIRLINKSTMDLLSIPEIKDLRGIIRVDEGLARLVENIQSGEKEMIRFIRHGRIMKLSIRATEFTLDGQVYKIVSLQDIKSELEEQELDSWQKLVRVLTHEIMNSAIPITNMVSMAKQILLDENGVSKEIPGLSEEDKEDLMISLNTAESRSQGLSSFVQSTKSLSQVPEPTFGDISVKDLFTRLNKIFAAELKKENITLNVSLQPENLILKADVDLIEQVTINLIRNAVEALRASPEPVIELSACKTSEGSMVLKVQDNGQGIPEDNLDQIFVPFFSTKKEGSGIGMSLSLQIMKLHKGRIDVQSEEGKGTTITLIF